MMLYSTVTPEVTISGFGPWRITCAHKLLYGGNTAKLAKLSFMQCIPRSFQPMILY